MAALKRLPAGCDRVELQRYYRQAQQYLVETYGEAASVRKMP